MRMVTACGLKPLAQAAGRGARVIHRGERGAMVMWFVFTMLLLMAVGAVAIDYGGLVTERRDQQKSVDSIVLAGVQELPENLVLADNYAREWGLRNGVQNSEIITLTLDNTCWNDHPADDPAVIDSITADISRSGQLLFLAELGFTIDVGAHAKACVGSLREAEGLRPWSISILNSPCFEFIDEDPYTDPNNPLHYRPLYGQECEIRLESPSSQVGSIRLGDEPGDPCSENGGGASQYVENIAEGSGATCEIGDIVDTEPGLQVGPTITALQNLLNTEGLCDTAYGAVQGTLDTYDDLLEVFDVPNGGAPSPETVFTPKDCGFDADLGTPDSPRFVSLVLIDEFDSPNGFGSEPIIGFAGFFILRCDAYENDGITFKASYRRCDVPNGDRANVAIVGTFIQHLKLGGPGGPLNPFGVRILALVE